jgi:hypothetical protein
LLGNRQSALSAKCETCWSEEANPINDNWLLECEDAEECDDQEDECNEEPAAQFNCFGRIKASSGKLQFNFAHFNV